MATAKNKLLGTFQFTPVLRRATQKFAILPGVASFNSRPSCDGRPRREARRRRGAVSIHARLATGDRAQDRPRIPRAVSIHARLATGDACRPEPPPSCSRFNSRPSCDGRLLGLVDRLRREVSIHARLATGDNHDCVITGKVLFQFTPVLRRATPFALTSTTWRSFNSRPSCDGRRNNIARRCGGRGFNSRPSCDGRLSCVAYSTVEVCFNSRPSCDGRPLARTAWRASGCFNSRPSCDGRRARLPRRTVRTVSIHARLATGDAGAGSGYRGRDRFNSRPSCDGRHVASRGDSSGS